MAPNDFIPGMYRPRGCVKCGERAHRLETRGLLFQDRLKPTNFVLQPAQPFVVCIGCGHVLDAKDYDPSIEIPNDPLPRNGELEL